MLLRILSEHKFYQPFLTHKLLKYISIKNVGQNKLDNYINL